jgi:hypothetical protein
MDLLGGAYISLMQLFYDPQTLSIISASRNFYSLLEWYMIGSVE